MTDPIYTYLRSMPENLQFGDNKEYSGGITWNFAKYLVDQDGKFVKYFDPTVWPVDLKPHILKLLEQDLKLINMSEQQK
jgi:glutathione peroxidase-family protein